MQYIIEYNIKLFCSHFSKIIKYNNNYVKYKQCLLRWRVKIGLSKGGKRRMNGKNLQLNEENK